MEDKTAVLLSALAGSHVSLSLLQQFDAHEVLRQFVRSVQPSSHTLVKLVEQINDGWRVTAVRAHRKRRRFANKQVSR